MGVMEKIRNVGFGVGGFAFMSALMAIPVMLLFGMTWLSMKVYPLLIPVFFWTLVVCVLLLGPMSFFAKTRRFASAGFLLSSYVYGAALWMWALLLTNDLWGMIAVVIGILIAGVGIVPVALLAALFHAEWAALRDLVIMIAITFGGRLLAVWLAQKADRESQGIYG